MQSAPWSFRSANATQSASRLYNQCCLQLLLIINDPAEIVTTSMLDCCASVATSWVQQPPRAVVQFSWLQQHNVLPSTATAFVTSQLQTSSKSKTVQLCEWIHIWTVFFHEQHFATEKYFNTECCLLYRKLKYDSVFSDEKLFLCMSHPAKSEFAIVTGCFVALQLFAYGTRMRSCVITSKTLVKFHRWKKM